MKTIALSSPSTLETLKIEDREVAPPGPGQITVKWRASSLNFHDYLVVAGRLPAPAGRIPLSDAAGEVIAIGPGVTRWSVGDKVMSLFFPEWFEGKGDARVVRIVAGDSVDGYATEQSTLSAEAVTGIPDGYSYAEAATLPCAALTAWHIVVEAFATRPGDSVLIEGTGGLSIFALQFARACGARVFATTSSDEKAERLKALGADAVVNYKTDPKWGETIYKLSGGVHHIVDVGGPATLTQSIAAAKVGGDVAIVGVLGGRSAEVLLPTVFFKQLRLQGVSVGSRAHQRNMVAGIETNGIKPLIDSRFALDALAPAFRHQLTHQHFGKIVIEY